MMKHYIFKIEHIKLNTDFIGKTYGNVLKSACFQSRNFPASIDTKVINHAFDFANQYTKDTWFNMYNSTYMVSIEYQNFESDINAPKLEVGKTLTISPLFDDERDLAYEEQIILNRACNSLYKTLPENLLKTAGLSPGVNFFDEKYTWTSNQKASLWCQFIGELQITLEYVKDIDI
jgi:hypothetical protein